MMFVLEVLGLSAPTVEASSCSGAMVVGNVEARCNTWADLPWWCLCEIWSGVGVVKSEWQAVTFHKREVTR